MYYKLYHNATKSAVFEDDGFSIGKKHYLYSDIDGISTLGKATALTNKVITISLHDGKYISVGYDKKMIDDGEAVLAFLQNIVGEKHEIERAEGVDLSNAETCYDYCISHNLGTGFSKKTGLKHFGVIIDNLMPDERILLPFIGMHNYESASKHDGYFAFALTNKRIIMGQKKVIGENFQSINISNVYDLSLEKKLLMGILTVNTPTEKFKVGVTKESADNINKCIHQILDVLKKNPEPIADHSSNEMPAESDPYEEIKKAKELFDQGILTEEEFAAKKKQLLNI